MNSLTEQMGPLFEQWKGRSLVDVVADPEFKGMPLKNKRALMDLFNEQAGERRLQNTMTGTAWLGNALADLLIMKGIIGGAKLPPKVSTVDKMAGNMAKSKFKLNVPNARRVETKDSITWTR